MSLHMHVGVGSSPDHRVEGAHPSEMAGSWVHTFSNVDTARAGHWWLNPMILATQEAEIRRKLVEASLGK
jgi:hypothetical protein